MWCGGGVPVGGWFMWCGGGVRLTMFSGKADMVALRAASSGTFSDM